MSFKICSKKILPRINYVILFNLPIRPSCQNSLLLVFPTGLSNSTWSKEVFNNQELLDGARKDLLLKADGLLQSQEPDCSRKRGGRK